MSVATLVAPAVLHEPPGRAGTYGDDVAEIADRLGRAPEPEQKLAIDALVAHDRRGRFLSVEAGVEGPRQSTGKTGGIMLPIIFWTALTDPDLITWTSHLADTHIGSFRELAGSGPRDDSGLIASNDWLRRRVRSISYENGAEGVSFVNGAQLDFRCRSARRGRGRSGATVFSDEALFLEAAAMGALLPTLATRSLHGNARAYYASSAPLKSSLFLWSLLRRAAAGDRTLTWVAWRAPGSWADPGCEVEGCGHAVDTPGCALDNPELLRLSNILLGRRTSMEFLRSMRQTFRDDPFEFGREFLGWGEALDDEAVDLGRWAGLADPRSRPESRPVALAFAVSPGGKSAAVVLVGRRADGVLHVELKEHEAGTAWLGPALLAYQERLGVPAWHRSGRTPEAAVVPGLAAAGVRLEPVKAAAWAPACDALGRAVDGGGLRHLGDPRWVPALAAVVRRDAGDGSWEMTWRGSSGDAAPVMALVAGVHGLSADAGLGQFVF